MKYILAIAFLSLAKLVHSEPNFPPECPTRGTGEVVENPKTWADNCFMAVSGRTPKESSYETNTVLRDLNLDGTNEHLEIRGTGMRQKAIYVFSMAGGSFTYMGQL